MHAQSCLQHGKCEQLGVYLTTEILELLSHLFIGSLLVDES